jgi:TnpA family transposase
LRGLQREINDGRNVIESWNRANSIIFYGKTRNWRQTGVTNRR